MVEDEVAAEVVLDDARLTGPGHTSVLRFTWRPDEPLAVTLTLVSEPEHPSLPSGEWVILRDFLRYGLDEPTGDGEVRLRPDTARDRLRLHLQRPGRAASVSVSRPLVAEFLDRTEDSVPAGEERSEAAINELLARLLSE